MPARETDASYYQKFLAEREEIARYKWIESQKAGRDIGFESALVDWAAHHRALWRNKNQAQEKTHTA